MSIEIAFPERILKKLEEISRREEVLPASQMVKAVAAKRNLELRSHGDLNRFVADVRREVNEPEIRRVWQIATSLHQNFYEAWLPGETVKESVEDTY